MAEDREAGADARIAEVATGLLTDDASLVASLQRVAEASCSLLDGCVAASITIVQGGRPATVAASAEVAARVDAVQYVAGEGPCLDGALEARTVLVPRISGERRWPAFVAASAELGVDSCVSVALHLPGEDTHGGINCYATAADAFADVDVHLAEGFAAQASAVVSNTIAYWSAFDHAANLARAMEHRAVIEQAKGILMATQRCTADQAFDLLRRASQRENRKLRDIAVEIVDRTAAQDGT